MGGFGRRSMIGCVCGAALWSGAWAGAQSTVKPEDPTPATPGTPAATAPASGTFSVKTVAVGEIKTADDLLGMLESAGRDLRTLQADIRWSKEFGEITGGGERQLREGTLVFESTPTGDGKSGDAKPKRRFQVDFVSETVDRVRHAKRVTYVFDGEWFVERQPDQKQVIRRQVVPPGQTIDPLAIGEGPFPIPIGQQRAKILERFDAELLTPGDGFDGSKAPESLADTHQLRLVPKRGSDEAKQFQSVRIWYRKSDLLPRMAWTTDRDDSKTEVFLTNMRLNEAVPKGAFDTTRPQGWEGDDTNYQRRKADE